MYYQNSFITTAYNNIELSFGWSASILKSICMYAGVLYRNIIQDSNVKQEQSDS